MHTLYVLRLNVHGLRAEWKQGHFLNDLKMHRSDIVVVTETRLSRQRCSHRSNMFTRKLFPHVYTEEEKASQYYSERTQTWRTIFIDSEGWLVDFDVTLSRVTVFRLVVV